MGRRDPYEFLSNTFEAARAKAEEKQKKMAEKVRILESIETSTIFDFIILTCALFSDGDLILTKQRSS